MTVTSWRERDRRWRAVVLASGITEPLIHLADRLTQVTTIVVGSQQALLHRSLRNHACGPRVEAAAPDRTLEDRQNPDQDLGIAVLHWVRHGNSRIGSHDTTMPRAYHLALGHADPGWSATGQTLLQVTQTSKRVKDQDCLPDVFGMSGRRILDALVAGERSPAALAALGDRRLKATPRAAGRRPHRPGVELTTGGL